MELNAIPAFEDNYIWMLQHGQRAVVVDPGDAAPVIEALRTRSLTLDSILVTHHHADHVAGIHDLMRHHPARIFGPGLETLNFAYEPLWGGERLDIMGIATQVMSVPGHTSGHIAYVLTPPNQAPILFCGDTLFSAGCGRLFEGTASQMAHSLETLAACPDTTRVCCAHEYTLSNLRFALAIEPENTNILSHQRKCQDQRSRGEPTLPSTLLLEKQINPFLRLHEPQVIRAAQHRHPQAQAPSEVLGALREWKNQFK